MRSNSTVTVGGIDSHDGSGVDGAAALPGVGVDSRFERVVRTLRELWGVDDTSSITGISVACTLRTRLPDSVPLSRGAEEADPDVVVDRSIGVVVLDGEDPGSARERVVRAARRVDKLVVYANPRARAIRTGLASLPEVADGLDLMEFSFVGGGVAAGSGPTAAGSAPGPDGPSV